MQRWREVTRTGVRVLTRAPYGASWVGAVDTISALVFGVITLGALVVMSVPAANAARTEPLAVALIAICVVLAGLLAVVDLAAHGRERARFLPPVLVLCLGAFAVAFLRVPPGPREVQWWPLNILYLLSIYLIAVTYGSRTGWVATLMASGGVLLAVFVALPIDAEDQLRLGVLQLVVVATILATVDLWVRGLRRIALESDRIDAQRLADLRTTSRAGREAVRLRDVERYIHDEVLHTLRAVAMERVDLPGSLVRAWCRRLAEQLRPTTIAARVDPADAPSGAEPRAGSTAARLPDDDDRDRTTTYADLAARLRALELPLDIDWHMPRTVLLPTDVAEAFVAATAEALRNVVRHAGVPTATVTVRVTTTSVDVTVRDEGRGFDPREQRLTRHGVARSVLGRMNDLGGTARVDSAPGEGTTVALRWAPRVPRVGGRTFPWADGTVRDVVRRCILVLYPFTVAAVVLTLLSLPRLERPWLALAAVTVIAVVVLVVPRTSLTRGLGPFASAGLLTLGVAVALAFGFAVPADSVDPSALIALPCASLIPIVLLFTRPLWEGVIAWLLLTATSLVISTQYAGTTADVVAMWGTIVSPGVAVAAAVVLRFAVDRFGSATYFASDARARAQGEAARARSVRASVATRLDEVNASVRPFIEDVAAGRLDAAAPDVRARADELERAVREDLSLGVAPGVRAAVESLRREGAVVELRVPQHPPAEVDAAVASMVGGLVAAQEAAVRAAGAEIPADSGADPAAGAGADSTLVDGAVTRHLGLTVTPRDQAWIIALLARTDSEDAAARLAHHWRAELEDGATTVMTIEGDVRARALVPVSSALPVEDEGRRDA